MTGSEASSEEGHPSRDSGLSVLRVVSALDFGGVESLLTIQARLGDRKSFRLRVVTFHKDLRAAEEVRAAGVPVDCLRTSPAVRNPRATFALARYLAQHRPDIVHASIPEACFHAGIVGPTWAGGTILDDAGMTKGTGLKGFVWGLLHRRASAVVAMSDAMANLYRDKLQTPSEKIRVIRNCADERFFSAPKPSYETGNPLRVVAVGRLTAVKNHVVLIRAIQRLAERGFDARLEIIGGGELEGFLRETAERHQVSDRVSIPGFVDDMLTRVRQSDIYALPSLMEGCSLSLLESLAGGMPVLASDVPGNREVIERCGGFGLVPPEDDEAWANAIESLGRMPSEERQQIGAAARRGAEAHFSPRAHIEGVERLYRRVWEQQRSRAGLRARIWRVR